MAAAFTVTGCSGPRLEDPAIGSSSSSSSGASAKTLNDTGMGTCATLDGGLVACADTAALAGQDGKVGRDIRAARGELSKVGGGMAGFDFTKIGSDGKALPIQNQAWQASGSEALGSFWRCVQDNHRGLLWEVKLSDVSSQQYYGYKYSWYSTDATTNGGSAGDPGTGDCGGLTCNTQKYVEAINAQGLCGRQNWRLPKLEELLSIAHSGRSGLAVDVTGGQTEVGIDINYFPNTWPSHYWSATAFALYDSQAWYGYFTDGSMGTSGKQSQMYVRLVSDVQ